MVEQNVPSHGASMVTGGEWQGTRVIPRVRSQETTTKIERKHVMKDMGSRPPGPDLLYLLREGNSM